MSTAGDELRSRVAPLLEVPRPCRDRHKDPDAHRAACRERMRRYRADPAYARAEREYESRPEVRTKRKVARLLKEARA